MPRRVRRETALHDTSLIAPFDGELAKKRIELASCVSWSTEEYFSACTSCPYEGSASIRSTVKGYATLFLFR
jgi:hypothetical protein